jgi:pimeloyl-ACP methyl ester carboxylesterase
MPSPPADTGHLEVRHRTIATNDVELHVAEAGTSGDPLVVLAHGFPELGYAWRHQMAALAGAGYHVLAPDQRGYGESSRPTAVEDYDIVHLTGDLVGLLDAEGASDAVFVGHDWGAMVVWNLALLAPERVRGVVGMSVPFVPRPAAPPVQMMRALFADGFFYMVYFQEPGVADAELGGDARRTMTRMMCALTTSGTEPDALAGDGLADFFANDGRGFIDRMPEPEAFPPWLGRDELEHYIEVFERTGFTGGINWYRNLDRNWELTPHLDGATVEQPALFVTGANDPVRLMTPDSIMEGCLDDPRGSIVIDGAGHWVQQEKPDEVNAALLGFLGSL